MTDPDRLPAEPPPATPLDELASALLDGEASAGEAARADDPQVAARLEAFTQVRDAVGAPVPPVDEARREAAIAGALDAWTVGEYEPAPPTQTSSDELAARRRDRQRVAKRWLGVAAAAVIVVGLGAALASGPDGAEDAASSDDTTAAAAETDAADGADPDDEALEGSGAGQQGALAVPQLGSFDDPDELLDEAHDRQLLTESPSSSPVAGVEDSDQAVRFQSSAPLADLVGAGGEVVAVARLAGRDVAIATEGPASELRLVVVALDDCTVLARRAP